MMNDQYKPFRIFAADYSLRRPGFALLHYDPRRNKVTVNSLSDIDNRIWGKPYGYLLERIFDVTCKLSKQADVFVREGSWHNEEPSGRAMTKVIGVADMALWATREATFYDIQPSKVKQLITGNGAASKLVVAGRLRQYVGNLSFTCLDQSDAVAVGIAWLMEAGFIGANAQVKPQRVRVDLRHLGLPTQDYYNYPHMEALQHGGQ